MQAIGRLEFLKSRLDAFRLTELAAPQYTYCITHGTKLHSAAGTTFSYYRFARVERLLDDTSRWT